MITRIPKQIPIMTAKAATGVGSTALVNDYKNVALLVTTAGNATLTVKVQGSLAAPENPPDFSSAASSSNPWTYVASYDMSDPSSVITGPTGISASGTDVVRQVIVNTDELVHLNASVTSRSAGSVNVVAVAYNNL